MPISQSSAGTWRSNSSSKCHSHLSLSLCNSVSDSDMRNCNGIFWFKHREREARNLWDMGKALGLRFNGDENLIIKRLKEMEDRDVRGSGSGVIENGGETNSVVQ